MGSSRNAAFDSFHDYITTRYLQAHLSPWDLHHLLQIHYE